MKKLLACLLILAMTLQAAACGNRPEKTNAPSATPVKSIEESSTPPAEGEEKQEAAAPEKKSHYPVTIHSYNQKKEPVSYTYDRSPEKTLVYGKNNVEILLALGLADKIMMVADVKTVLPEYQAELDKIPNVKDTQNLGYFVREYALSLEPDMVIGWRSLFAKEDRMGSVDFWHERNIGTYINLNSAMKDDQSLENEYQDIRNLANIYDRSEAAEEMISNIEADVERGRRASAGKTSQRILIAEKWEGEYDVYHAKSAVGDIAAQLGATVLGEKGWTDEQIVEANPEAIFSVHVGSVTPEEAIATYRDNPALASVDAVKNGRIYPVAYGLAYTPGIRCGQTVKLFLKELYGLE